MNEVQLIRNQLAVEREHAGAVADACAQARTDGTPLADFRQACVDYLVCVLAWFEERDQRLGDFARARLAPGDAVRHALEEALARPGRSRETLERLSAAVAGTAADCGGRAAQESWQEFAQYFNRRWCARRDAIDVLLASHMRTADWRTVAGIDADSILEERQRYARVGARLPPGLTLTQR